MDVCDGVWKEVPTCRYCALILTGLPHLPFLAYLRYLALPCLALPMYIQYLSYLAEGPPAARMVPSRREVRASLLRLLREVVIVTF